MWVICGIDVIHVTSLRYFDCLFVMFVQRYNTLFKFIETNKIKNIYVSYCLWQVGLYQMSETLPYGLMRTTFLHFQLKSLHILNLGLLCCLKMGCSQKELKIAWPWIQWTPSLFISIRQLLNKLIMGHIIYTSTTRSVKQLCLSMC